MLLVLRALLVLCWSCMLHAGKSSQVVSVKLDRGRGLKTRTLRLVLDPSVLPPLSSTASSSSLANMSLSPWTYRDSYVPTRYPERISQAVCLTSGCLIPRGGGEDGALRAQPIRYQALVLRRVPSPSHARRGKRKPKKKKKKEEKDFFLLSSEVITVGCTCVRPTVVTRH